MRISKEISGNAQRRSEQARQGRGEYEIADTHGQLRPQDLFDRHIILDLPNGSQIQTRTNLTLQGGKRRIRLMAGAGERAYPHRQVAAMLLMPKPSRAEPSWGEGLPVMRTDQYGISDLELAHVDIELVNRVRMRVKSVRIMNQYQRDEIDFNQRFGRVQVVWANKDKFDESIAPLIDQHERLVNGGGPLGPQAERVVRDLQRAVSDRAADYGVLGNAPTTDVLPVLLQILGGIQGEAPLVLPAEEEVLPQPAADLEEVPPEEVEIRRRKVKEWKQWAACRGAASVRFRREVRRAYNSTCVVCGLRLPPLGANINPGVDAAHILPWSEFDLDHVSNGLCLCKLHHWAFDESLIEIIHDDGEYHVVVPDEAKTLIAEAAEAFSGDFILGCEGPIDPARLPANPADRPRPEFLAALREYLAST